MPGTLFVVSTPIGNLGDLSDRAREVLARVDLIACEDTRVTAKLLRRFQIRARTVSYHEHNELQRSEELLERLRSGTDVALVTDAGTPLVSDPGYRLVHAARSAGIEIRSVPGPSAVLAALAASGLPTAPFTFVGFLPRKGRAAAVESLARIDHTLVLFESGPRIERLLSELAEALGPRPSVLLREMTKLHEEHRAGTLGELASWVRGRELKGELTLVVGPSKEPPREDLDSLGSRFRELREAGLTAREASRVLARERSVPSRLLYRRFSEKDEP